MIKLTASIALTALALTIGITSANAAVVGGNSRGGSSPHESSANCQGDMGFLFDVRPGQIRNLEDQRVYIEPVCEAASVINTVTTGDLAIEGNATGLRRTIGESDLLASALYERDYDANDVIGIRLNRTSGQVILYVHKNR